MVTQSDILLDLSYLMSETSIPASGIDDRKRFVNNAIEKVWNKFNFKAAATQATLSLTNGVGTLSSLKNGGVLDLRQKVAGVNTDFVFDLIEYEDQDKYDADAYVYWITGNDGGYFINTNQVGLPAVNINYIPKAPVLSAATDTVPFGGSMLYAKGALVEVRQSQNPMADVTPETAEFDKSIMELVRQESKSRPQRRVKSIMEVCGSRTGEI